MKYQLAVLEGIEHLEVTTRLTTVKVGHVLPETVNASECQEPVRVNLPCVPAELHKPSECIPTYDSRPSNGSSKFSLDQVNTAKVGTQIKVICLLLFDSLQSALGNGLPVGRISLALLEEINQELSRLVTMVRVNVEARLSMDYDLSRTTMASSKRGQPTSHGLDHSQPKGLIESGLDKCSPGVRNVPVELSIPNPVHLGRDPPELPIQVVLLNQTVHFLHLFLLFYVLGFLPPVTSNHNKVHKLSQPLVLTIPLNKTCHVLHPI